MSRLTLSALLACAVVFTGCQKAKMTGVKPAASDKPSTQYNPPPTYPINPPPRTEVYPHYTEPPVVDVHEVAPLPAEPVCQRNCGPQVVDPTPAPSCHDSGTCQPVKGECEPVQLNAQLEAPKLDVLFVVDTSASLRGGSYRSTGGELGQLARDMRYFMNRLDQKTDVRIGMILGHGPDMQATHGRLFSTGSNDPAVIDYKRIQEAVKAANHSASAERIRTLAQQEVGRLLERKMINMPRESQGAQGEALLLSLYHAMTRSNLRGQIKSAGLLRRGVPLAVIMVSDEQDVCFDYAANGKTPRKEDDIEVKFFNQVCSTAVNGGPLRPGHVYSALQSVAGEKLIVTGIHYKNNSIPQGREDENEMGYGFLDLISLANGQVADLAQVNDQSPNFWAQLDQLGKFADFKMRFTNSFACRSDVHPRLVDDSTLEVRIFNKSGEQVGLFSKQCGGDSHGCEGSARWQIVTGDNGNPYGRAIVPSQVLGDLFRRINLEQATVRISFMARRDGRGN